MFPRSLRPVCFLVAVLVFSLPAESARREERLEVFLSWIRLAVENHRDTPNQNPLSTEAGESDRGQKLVETLAHVESYLETRNSENDLASVFNRRSSSSPNLAPLRIFLSRFYLLYWNDPRITLPEWMHAKGAQYAIDRIWKSSIIRSTNRGIYEAKAWERLEIPPSMNFAVESIVNHLKKGRPLGIEHRTHLWKELQSLDRTPSWWPQFEEQITLHDKDNWADLIKTLEIFGSEPPSDPLARLANLSGLLPEEIPGHAVEKLSTALENLYWSYGDEEMKRSIFSLYSHREELEISQKLVNAIYRFTEEEFYRMENWSHYPGSNRELVQRLRFRIEDDFGVARASFKSRLSWQVTKRCRFLLQAPKSTTNVPF